MTVQAVAERGLEAARAVADGPWQEHGRAELTIVSVDNWSLRLTTGGWSDNEHALGEFPIELQICWVMSARGGLHIYGKGASAGAEVKRYAARDWNEG